jgi:hypothetical protein
MVIFNSYVKLPEGNPIAELPIGTAWRKMCSATAFCDSATSWPSKQRCSRDASVAWRFAVSPGKNGGFMVRIMG